MPPPLDDRSMTCPNCHNDQVVLQPEPEPCATCGWTVTRPRVREPAVPVHPLNILISSGLHIDPETYGDLRTMIESAGTAVLRTRLFGPACRDYTVTLLPGITLARMLETLAKAWSDATNDTDLVVRILEGQQVLGHLNLITLAKLGWAGTTAS